VTGIVIVSHSRQLARAVKDLAEAMNPGARLQIGYAGGALGKDDAFGTDVTDVMAAIESVYDGSNGVLVFVDLGSAILSAEMAIELLGESYAGKVCISAAPLVEGALGAAVGVSGGHLELEALLAEARQALRPKQQHLGEQPPPVPKSPLADHSRTQSREFVLTNPHGLHARPAARLVRCISSFTSECELEGPSKAKGPASGRSLSQLLCLEIGQGQRLRVSARGDDAAALLNAVEALVQSDFADATAGTLTRNAPATARESAGGLALAPDIGGAPGNGIALAPGIGVGPACWLHSPSLDVPNVSSDEPEREEQLLRRALDDVLGALLSGKSQSRSARDEEREIFAAHAVLIRDPDLWDAALASVRERSLTAESAWCERVRALIARHEALLDPYLRARALDVKDVGTRVLLALGAPHEAPEVGEAIAVADELTPSDVLMLEAQGVQGILVAEGSATSHATILARGLGVPVVAAPATVASVRTGDWLVVDGFSGDVIRNPDETTLESHRARRHAWLDRERALRESARRPVRTLDDQVVAVFANVAAPPDCASLADSGADGIGLLRTEALFLHRRSPPTLEDHLGYFEAIFAAAGELRVTVRSFDLGADKPAAYLQQPHEDNPLLGARGIRLYERHAALFNTQIEALLRASNGRRAELLLPMITKPSELSWAKQRLLEIHDRLEGEGVAHQWPMPCGVMIETPASVLMAPELARDAAFFSIGTNDLTAYVLAAERGTGPANAFIDPLDPAVLRAIARVTEAAAAAGIPVCVCGEMAADPAHLPLLLGLGVTQISAHPGAIPALKAKIGTLWQGALRNEMRALVASAIDAATIRRRLAQR
jgi:phosphoenolpyruvate-protein phosphotransferase/dihydroxyacetone kinase phosphotransfer subunit